MRKKCEKCNMQMDLKLRKVVYMNHMEIDHVPVYSCPNCEENQLVEQVKDDLKRLLQQINTYQSDSSVISFAAHSSFSELLLRMSRQNVITIDDLLDLYLLARSLQDDIWIEEIEKELRLRSNYE
ncbi:hypothetical protein [Aneurinibacillus terranovensis]|uniref:hypothetical protein n=1 Tax=Aneurinibacillus terranovensis TaxID=278991 RepID=UPI0004033B33|nr:hypothetical protein [Aneurinibacillus terranovensis]